MAGQVYQDVEFFFPDKSSQFIVVHLRNIVPFVWQLSEVPGETIVNASSGEAESTYVRSVMLQQGRDKEGTGVPVKITR